LNCGFHVVTSLFPSAFRPVGLRGGFRWLT
jgi:hypothetical protein